LLPLLWIFEGDFKRKLNQIKSSKALVALIFFVSFILLSMFWTKELIENKREIRLLLYYFTTLVIATSFNPRFTEKAISSFVLGMFISVAIGYGVFFGLWEFKHATAQNLSPFMYHLEYSLFLAFVSILLLNKLFYNHYTNGMKMVYFLLFLFFLVALFLGMGRTGQVAFIVGLVVLSVIRFELSLKTILLSFMLIASILTFAFFTSNTFQERVYKGKSDIEKMVQNQDYTTSLGIRVAFWKTTYGIFKDNPLLGVGVGDFKLAVSKELKKEKYNTGFYKEFMTSQSPHNQYLLVLVQVGIIGFGLFVYLLYQFVKIPIKNREIKAINILFATILFTSFMTDTFLRAQFSLTLFAIMFGIFVANSTLKKDSN
jgi:O-antigen ligase